MDLNDLWQNHRRFILGVGAGMLVLIVGKVVIGSTWNAGEAERLAQARLSKVTKAETIAKNELAAVQGATAKNTETLTQLTARMRFKPDPRYVLDKNEKTPDLKYNEIRSRAAEELVEVAARSNIRVDETLGLPDFTPAGREAIQRYLFGLNVVGEVVESAIVAGVRSVDDIDVIDAKGKRSKDKRQLTDSLTAKFRISGSASSLAELVSRIVRDEDQFLSVDDAQIEVDKKKAAGLATMTISVSALVFEEAAE